MTQPSINTQPLTYVVTGTRKILYILFHGMHAHPDRTFFRFYYHFYTTGVKEKQILTKDEGSSSLGITTRYSRTLPASPS